MFLISWVISRKVSHRVKNKLFANLMEQCVVDDDLKEGMRMRWNTAQLLHSNFYNDFMEADQVNENGVIVGKLVSELGKLDLKKFNSEMFLSTLKKDRTLF